jgi:hypothetical protein
MQNTSLYTGKFKFIGRFTTASKVLMRKSEIMSNRFNLADYTY